MKMIAGVQKSAAAKNAQKRKPTCDSSHTPGSSSDSRTTTPVETNNTAAVAKCVPG